MPLKAALFSMLFCASMVHADRGGDEARPFGSHPGYVSNVYEERTKRDVEMVMLDKPKPENSDVKKRVFINAQLTKEFQDQYRYRFGTTAAEQVINNPARDSEYTYYNNHSVTFAEYQRYQRDFGNYMIRRLAEWHIDDYFRNDPALKPIYQAKDRFSNMDVSPRKGYKAKFKYNLAGPSIDVTVENPYDVETRAQILMNGLISAPREQIYSVGYKLTTRVRFDFLHRSAQRLNQFVLSRRMTRHTTLSLTSSSGYISPEIPIHQDLTLIGFGYSE